jgi:hypothetical protein
MEARVEDLAADSQSPAGQEESTVLEEVLHAEYTQGEIDEYATWLGFDLDHDKNLLWVAQLGLQEPLPEHWKPCQSPQGEIYYFNFATGESSWDHPCDDQFRRLFRMEKSRSQSSSQPRDVPRDEPTMLLASPPATARGEGGSLAARDGTRSPRSGRRPVSPSALPLGLGRDGGGDAASTRHYSPPRPSRNPLWSAEPLVHMSPPPRVAAAAAGPSPLAGQGSGGGELFEPLAPMPGGLSMRVRPEPEPEPQPEPAALQPPEPLLPSVAEPELEPETAPEQEPGSSLGPGLESGLEPEPQRGPASEAEPAESIGTGKQRQPCRQQPPPHQQQQQQEEEEKEEEEEEERWQEQEVPPRRWQAWLRWWRR